MPVRAAQVLLLGLGLGLASGMARAQGFVPDEEDEPAPEQTRVHGSLTSTTFAHRETGSIGEPLMVGAIAPENASPFSRVFSDLRAQLDADHVQGGRWDVRLDSRVRQIAGGPAPSSAEVGDELPYQSGAFAGGEYDVRELYARRRGRKTDWLLGRQIVLDVAALKIDGLRFVHRRSARWEVTGFAGFHPVRGSRSITDDYPRVVDDAGQSGARIMPIAAGLAASYRLSGAHGALGVAGILPRATDEATGTLEQPRIFATSSGYWRRSSQLDVYHYLVVDAQSSAGAGLRNLTLGVNLHPTHVFRITAQVSRVDTETLNVTAQTRLEDPEPAAGAAGRIQNNIAVQRIAAESAELGLSLAMARGRYELSWLGQVRRRPALTVQTVDGQAFAFAEAQAADVTVRLLDRRSFAGLRLGGSATATFGIGQESLQRASAKIVRVFGARELGPRSELEAEVTYLTSEDDGQGTACVALDPLTCYGTSQVSSLGVGGSWVRRFGARWLLFVAVTAGRQSLVSDNAAGERVAQPPITVTTGFLRASYRF
jgi:hypothetical protein